LAPDTGADSRGLDATSLPEVALDLSLDLGADAVIGAGVALCP
jgi:hypothetical protein